MSKQHPHEGHRQRLKDTFLKTSLDTFQPHNILELLLFYSIPRQDTNEIAHELINHFGSLKNVFDADYEELIRVKGIKENSAVLIKMIPQLAKIYLSNKPEERELFDSFQKVGDKEGEMDDKQKQKAAAAAAVAAVESRKIRRRGGMVSAADAPPPPE